MVAEYLDPAQQIENPTPEQQNSLRRGWENWLAQPDHRAALLQFGLNMMAPMAPGQNFMGHLAGSVGAAGETIAGREAQRAQQAEQALNRKLSLADLGLRGADLGLRREDLGLRREADEREAGYTERRLGQTDEQIRLEAERNAIAARRAEAAIKPPAGGWTDKDISNWKIKLAGEYDDALLFDRSMRDEEGNPVITREEFVRQQFDAFGIPWQAPPRGPAANIMATPEEIAAGDVVAGGAGDGPAPPPPPPPPPTPKPTAAQLIQTAPPAWAMVKAGLASPDPVQRAHAEVRLRLLAAKVSDPQALEAMARAGIPAPAPAAAAPPAVVPPAALSGRAPVGLYNR